MKNYAESKNTIETAVKISTKIPEDLTLDEKSYILGVIEGMRAIKSLHTPTDKPEKTA